MISLIFSNVVKKNIVNIYPGLISFVLVCILIMWYVINRTAETVYRSKLVNL